MEEILKNFCKKLNRNLQISEQIYYRSVKCRHQPPMVLEHLGCLQMEKNKQNKTPQTSTSI